MDTPVPPPKLTIAPPSKAELDVRRELVNDSPPAWAPAAPPPMDAVFPVSVEPDTLTVENEKIAPPNEAELFFKVEPETFTVAGENARIPPPTELAELPVTVEETTLTVALPAASMPPPPFAVPFVIVRPTSVAVWAVTSSTWLAPLPFSVALRSEEHTSELQSQSN